MTGPVAAVWYRDADTGAATVVLHEDGEDVTLAALDTETGSKGSLTVTGVQYADGRRIPRAEWTAFLDVLARRNARPRHEPPEDEPIGHVRDPFTGALAPIYWPEDHPDWLGDLLPSDASDGTTVADAPDLAEFLRQRLDEDEAAARAAASVIPDAEGWYRVAQEAITDPEFARLYGRAYPHIARWDPALVLAETKAKRAILDAYDRADPYGPWDGCGDDCEWKAIAWAIRQLAQPYTGHPDFDPSWASDD